MATRPTKPTETKPTTQAASPPDTFDVNDPAFQAIVAQAVAVRLAAIEAEKPKMAIAGKSEASIKNDLAAVRAFKKAGFGVLVPHKNIMTFNRWVELGFRPVEGSKSVKVGNLRLFCKAQCRPLTKDDLKAMQEQKAAHESRKGNAAKGPKVVPINGQAEIPL
jgi:hypothetical protein